VGGGWCRNLNFGLATKVRACKVTGQEKKPRNERKCEGMNPHTPKGAFTLGVESRWTSECSKSDFRGQNPMD